MTDYHHSNRSYRFLLAPLLFLIIFTSSCYRNGRFVIVNESQHDMIFIYTGFDDSILHIDINANTTTKPIGWVTDDNGDFPIRGISSRGCLIEYQKLNYSKIPFSDYRTQILAVKPKSAFIITETFEIQFYNYDSKTKNYFGDQLTNEHFPVKPVKKTCDDDQPQ